MRHVRAARAGVTMHLMPPFGVTLSAMFLREYPSWYHFAGIALVLAASAYPRKGLTSADLSEERVQ